MKKQKLVALVGTMALALNILLPSLAFGQANQTGNQKINGSTSILTVGPDGSLSTEGATTTFYFDDSVVGSTTYNTSYPDFFDLAGGTSGTYDTGEDYQLDHDNSDAGLHELKDYSFVGVRNLDNSRKCIKLSVAYNGFGSVLTGESLYFNTTTDLDANGEFKNYNVDSTGHILYNEAAGETYVTGNTTNNNNLEIDAASGNDSKSVNAGTGTLLTANTSATIFSIDKNDTAAIAQGDFGVGMLYALDIPDLTPAGEYTTQITYTLSTSDTYNGC